jgi:hypothetical protein
MPVMLLDANDTLALSVFSDTSPSKISPLQRHYLQKGIQLENDLGQEGFDHSHLLKDRLLVTEQDQTVLAKPLEPLLAVMNQPDLVLSFSRKALADTDDFIFCFRGGMGCELATNSLGTIDTIIFPVKTSQIRGWFAQELLEGIGGQSGIAPAAFYLSAAETVLLYAMQNVLQKRVETLGAPLGASHQSVSVSEMKQALSVMPVLPTVFGALFSQQEIMTLAQSDEYYQKALAGLTSKGYLANTNAGFRYCVYFQIQ